MELIPESLTMPVSFVGGGVIASMIGAIGLARSFSSGLAILGGLAGGALLVRYLKFADC